MQLTPLNKLTVNNNTLRRSRCLKNLGFDNEIYSSRTLTSVHGGQKRDLGLLFYKGLAKTKRNVEVAEGPVG